MNPDLANTFSRIALIFILSVGVLLAPVNGQNIGSGLPFLKVGAGADAIARGDAMTASASGAQALFYNPAGLARADESSVLIMHDQNVLGITNDILGSAVVLATGRWGLGCKRRR